MDQWLEQIIRRKQDCRVVIMRSLCCQRISTTIKRSGKAMNERVAYPPPTGVEQWDQRASRTSRVPERVFEIEVGGDRFEVRVVDVRYETTSINEEHDGKRG